MKRILSALLIVLMSLTLVACGGDTANETGRVYYVNFKPEADAAWQELAKKYTDETGVPVKVLTAASGTYDTVLTGELGKEEAPTMFQVGNIGAVNTYGDYCLDLNGTEVIGEQTTDAFNLTKDGATVSIGYCYESFGIITNLELLKKAGHDVSEIKDFASFKAVVEDIHARAGELGFDAFTSSGLDASSSWRFSGHLANMPLFYEFRDNNIKSQPETIEGKYLDQFKNIWDLYINNSATDKVANNTATGDQAVAEFKEGKAVFYQNGTWEYQGLIDAGMKPENLQMLPIYIGVEGEEKAALPSGTENCWAVNKNVSEADQKATLDFMKWVVTSDAGTTMMAEQFGPIPFKNAKEPANVFFKNANDLLANGNYNVDWAFNYTPSVDDWRAGVVSALQSYATTGDFAPVKDAFVTGWANGIAKSK